SFIMTSPTEIYILSLHDALPILQGRHLPVGRVERAEPRRLSRRRRSAHVSYARRDGARGDPRGEPERRRHRTRRQLARREGRLRSEERRVGKEWRDGWEAET